MKKTWIVCFLFMISTMAFAVPFNSKITAAEMQKINNGELVIRNINYASNMSLNSGISPLGDSLISQIKSLSPKYLAEVIQIKPYEGNEDLPERLEVLLNNIPEYAGIPYYSERHKQWFDLYTSAEILGTSESETGKTITANLVMDPFGNVKEVIEIKKETDTILYTAVNTEKLRYEKIDCVQPQKMRMCILLFRDGDNWVLYGIGGVNAPRIPFLTERIQTSFINRIKTFCTFIFEKF